MATQTCFTSPVYASFDAIFADTVFSFFSCIEVKNTDVLYVEEKALLKKQDARHLIDFCKGRYCAHRALEQIGCHASPILRDEFGAPIWPEGITGSISHSGNVATAVVALKTDIQGIGLDLQKRKIFPSAVLSILFHVDEVAHFLNITAQLSDLYSYAIFSAKESAIKCFYTVFNYLANLNEIAIEMDLWKGEFKAHIASQQSKKFMHSDCQLTGRIGFTEDYVFSVVWLPR